MKITLSENLRTLRSKESITQEQLAEALGVSPQAVSRWENEAAFPDISLLPVIANYFNVTVDYLLGVDTIHKQNEIDKIIETNTQLRNKGKTQESINYLREKVKEFPSEAKLLHCLACSLYSLYHQSGITFSEEEKRTMAKESIELCKRAVRYSNEQGFLIGCKQTLILNYVQIGENEKAKDIADTLPSLWCSREMIYPMTLTKAEAIKEYQNNILMLIDAIIITMGKLKYNENYTEEQIFELAEVREKLVLLLAGDNPCWLNERLFNMSLIQAKIQLHKKSDNLMNSIEKLLKYAKNYEERKQGGKYNVFWLSECTDSLEGVKHSSQNLLDILRDFIEKNKIRYIFENEKKMDLILKELDQEII